jgi:predicted nucleic acid-binding protein
LKKVKAIVEAHDLTAYDAAYLELARRENLPLPTVDKRLRKAAQKAAVGIFT